MSLKVVLGSLDKSTDVRSSAQQGSASQSPNLPSNSIPSSVQQSLSRAFQGSEAVVTTLRAFRTTGSPSSSRPIKNFEEAERLATDLAERIKEDKDEAAGAHDGVDSTKSGTVLVN